MKKLWILILTLVMAFSLTACKSKCEKKGHEDKDADGVCDRCDVTIENDTHLHSDADSDGYCDGCKAFVLDYGMPESVAKVLRKNFEKQISENNSVKIEFELVSDESDQYWDYFSDTVSVYGNTKNEKTTADITVSRTDKFFNAKIELTTETKEAYIYDEYVDKYEYENKMTYYFIDGILYVYASDGIYVSHTADMDLEEIFEKLSKIQLIGAEEREAALADLSTYLVTVINLRDNKGSVSVDLKSGFDDFKEYVAALDLETDTIGMLINDALALTDTDLTAAEIIDVIERVVGLTVHEAYDEINAWLTEEYGTTVQDIYETVVNDPEVEELFRYIYIESAGLDVEDDDDMEHLDEVIANIRAFSIDDFIGDERFEEMTVYEFVDGFETLPFALHENPEDFIAALRSLLEMTLAEFEDNNGMYLFTSLKNQISYVTVNELGGRVDFNFKNVLELESIEGVFKLDIIRATPSEYVEGKLDTVTTKVTAGFKIYDISKETVEIALDEDDSIIENALFDSSYSDPFDGYFAILKIYDYYNYGDETVMDLLVDISRDDGTWISIYYEYVPIEYLLDEDIVITAEYITSVDGAILDDGGNLDLRFKLTYDANDRIKLISVPETRALTLAETVFYSYLNGENEYGAEMDSAVEEIYDYGTTMRIYFYSGFDLKSIAYTLKYDIERDVFVGTITGVSVDSDHRLINADGNGYYGFNDDPNMMNAYFDGDPTFELYYDEETNTILFVEYPVVVEEYRSGW